MVLLAFRDGVRLRQASHPPGQFKKFNDAIRPRRRHPQKSGPEWVIIIIQRSPCFFEMKSPRQAVAGENHLKMECERLSPN